MIPQRQQNNELQVKDGLNLAYTLFSGHALACMIPMRKDFGREYLGWTGLAGFSVILVYGGLMNSYAMYVYLCLYLLMVLMHRIRNFSNRGKVITHSRYNGFPWLACKLFPRIRTEGNLKGAEAFLCLGLGWLLTYVDQPLGWFVMAGWFSIMFSESLIVETQRRRLQAMRDAEIEQQALAEQYREGNF
jgi:hypothetical protein